MPADNSQKRKPRSRAREPKKLTPEFVFACGKLFCTQEEIGDLCGLSQGRISTILNEDPILAQAFRTGRAQGKMSLRRAQAKKAITDGNLVAQIWLGKQELGQSDKQETHETQDLNITVQYVAAWGKSPNELPPPPSPDASESDTNPPGHNRTQLASSTDVDIIDSTATEDDDPPAPPASQPKP